MKILALISLQFTLFFNSTLAHAQDPGAYSSFLKTQWSKIQFRLPMPNENFLLPAGEQDWLTATADPAIRNQAINRRYFEIGDTDSAAQITEKVVAKLSSIDPELQSAAAPILSLLDALHQGLPAAGT